MRELSVNTGAVKVPVKDEFGEVIGEIRFIPTDADILRRYPKVAEFFREFKVPENAGDVTEILFSQAEKAQMPTDAGAAAHVTMGREIWEKALPFEKGVNGAVHTAHAEVMGSYEKPGTYFAAVRIASQRRGDASDPFTQVLNLDRVRVIVS